MSYAWTAIDKSTGTKKIAVHELGDGFLINMMWSWPEENIHQEIVFFSPIEQAREIAEEILAHVGRIHLRNLGGPDASSERGAKQINKYPDDTPSPMPPVP